MTSMPPAPPPPATPETIAAIQAGTSRDQLVSSLGTPSARISMFEDGRLVEIYRYSNSGSTVGAVRLANGSVETVTPARRQ
jgi:outer membrane protein assembly factor BamE (lipoprotein component of BamABCDE complex)